MRCPQIFYAPDDGGSGGNGSDGSQTVTVGSDDSILSIAKENGFWWSTVWNHPNNSALKSQRKVPEVLQQGDQVYVPALDPKKVPKPTDARHKFKLKGEQAKFKIRLLLLDQARANEDYILVIDGNIKTGKTDGNGIIECDIANDARGGVLKLKNGKEQYPITIGRLDPVDTPSGVRQRLKSLGYNPEPDPDDQMPKEALKIFQAKNKLSVSGEFDGATKAKLQELHPA